MHKIYAHPDTGVTHLLKNELEQNDIEAVIKGDHLAWAAGGAAANEAWYELWVEEDAQIQRALGIVHRFIQRNVVEEIEPSESWTCPNCGEEVEAQFALCWKCGHEAPEMS